MTSSRTVYLILRFRSLFDFFFGISIWSWFKLDSPEGYGVGQMTLWRKVSIITDILVIFLDIFFYSSDFSSFYFKFFASRHSRRARERLPNHVVADRTGPLRLWPRQSQEQSSAAGVGGFSLLVCYLKRDRLKTIVNIELMRLTITCTLKKLPTKEEKWPLKMEIPMSKVI